jgi:gliding motility-associated-like protein
MKFLIKLCLSTALIFLLYNLNIYSQTELNTGDIAVVGVNANNGVCSGTTTEDNISIVFFKDITTGTTIDFTDNGWERTNIGQWGNTEGTIRATRTGATIPAGTVVTFKFTATYASLFPDAAWSFSSINGMTTLNLNSGGDQIYFMQGGSWTNPNSGLHNSSYTGDILFGFNTKTTWVADGTTQQSNLYTGLGCFSMSPTGGATDFIKYTGDTSGTDQKSWVVRINNPTNWTSYASCALYNSGSYNYLSNIKFRITSFFNVNAGNDSTICSYNPSFALGGTPAGGTWSGTGVSAGTFDPATSGSGVFTVTYTYNDLGCLYYDTKHITVTALPDASWTSPGNWCISGGNINLNTLVTGQAGGTWAGTGFTGNSFNPATLNGNIPITYTVINGGCTNNAIHNINVTPIAAIALTSAAGTNAQSLCINTLANNITYSVTDGGTGASVSGLPTGMSGIYSGGTFTISGTPTVSGTFNYTVTTTGTCTQTTANGSITVNPNAAIALTSAIGTNSQSICINTLANNITYSVTGGGTGATVSGLPTGMLGLFSGGIFTISGTPTISGTFNFTVTTTGTCIQTTANGSIMVNPNAAIALTSAVGSNLQSLCINTSANNITYDITGGGTGANVSGLPTGMSGAYSGGTFTISGTPTISGTFNYIVTTTGTCTQTTANGSITVNPDAAILLTSAAGTNNQTLCSSTPITDITYSITNGGTGANIIGLPSGVSGNYSGGIFTISGTPSVSGTFNYTVTTTGTCIQTNASGTITITTIPIASISYDGNPFCTSVTTVTVTQTGSGSGTYSSTAGLTINTTNGTITPGTSSAGTYAITYTIPPSAGCPQIIAIDTVTINPLPIATSSSTNIQCNGGSATVTVNGSGGTAPYAGTGDFTVTTGTYSYIVTDNNGCSATTNITVNEPTALIATSTATPILCNGETTTVVVSANGGTLPYFGDDIYTENAGIFSYIVTDNNGCTSSTTITLTEPTAINSTIATTLAGCGLSNGNATVTASGGTGTLSYLWTSGGTNAIENNLAAGSYTVTITDNNNCTSTNIASISNIGAPSTSTIPTNILCNGLNNGAIDLTVNGGTGPFNFLWNNAAITEDLSNISAGTYNYTVTDASNCQATGSVNLTEPTLLIASATSTPILCNGETTSITIIANGGTLPYTGIGNFTENAGNYNYVITDNNGCTSSTIITVNEPSIINISSITTNPTCFGNNNGSISLTVDGGTPSYNYTWLGNITTQNISNIGAGSYTVTVSDANNCTAILNSTITSPTPILISDTILTNSNNTANIDITVTGGLFPYNYQWSNSETTQDISNLTNGTYIVTVTDMNLCISLDSFTINIPDIPFTIPSVITPNNDNTNDDFEIKNIQYYSDVTVQIFNRWGDQIFKFKGSGIEYNDKTNRWNGKLKGKDLPMGGYVYIVIIGSNNPVTGVCSIIR